MSHDLRGGDGPVIMVRDAQGRLLAIPADQPELIPAGAVPVNAFSADAVPPARAAAPAIPAPSAGPGEDAPVVMVRDAQGRLIAVPADRPELIPPGAVLVNAFSADAVPPARAAAPAVLAPSAGPGEDAPLVMVRDAQGRLTAVPADRPELVPAGAVPVNAFSADAVPPARAGEDGAVMGGIAPADGPYRTAPVFPPPPAGRAAAVQPPEPLIESRSEELQEVVSFVPHWLVRWGITVVFGVVATLLAISWLVRYPEVVAGRATLTTPEPPVRLVPRVAGEVDVLFVTDGQAVERGTVLGVMRNAASYEAVQRLSAALERLDPADPARGGAVFAPEAALGDLQGPYTALQQALADLRDFAAAPYDLARMGGLQVQMQSQERLRDNLAGQQSTLQAQLQMAERERDRNRELAARQLISTQELEKAEADYLQKALQLENARNALTTSDIQIAGQSNTLLDLQQKRAELRREYVQAVRGAADALRAARDRWRQENLLVAPTGGRVSFFRPLARAQYLPAGEPVLAVVPGGGRALAQVLVPQAASGKVRAGQKVVIRVDGFPVGEFGTLAGRVEKVSLLPDDQKEDEPRYLLQVALPDGLVTSYGKSLPFRQEMRGAADVVTEDVRLFERVFHQLYEIVVRARG